MRFIKFVFFYRGSTQFRWASLLCITTPKRYYHLPFFFNLQGLQDRQNMYIFIYFKDNHQYIHLKNRGIFAFGLVHKNTRLHHIQLKDMETSQIKMFHISI